eukprot:8929158-Karenia_brevis.AAC.1
MKGKGRGKPLGLGKGKGPKERPPERPPIVTPLPKLEGPNGPLPIHKIPQKPPPKSPVEPAHEYEIYPFAAAPAPSREDLVPMEYTLGSLQRELELSALFEDRRRKASFAAAKAELQQMNETPVVGQKEVNRESLKILDKMTKDRQYWASQDDPVSREIESPSDTENPPDPGAPS